MIIFISTIIIEHISMHYKQERPEQYQARAGRNPSLCPSLSCALCVFRRELRVEGCIKTKRNQNSGDGELLSNRPDSADGCKKKTGLGATLALARV